MTPQPASSPIRTAPWIPAADELAAANARRLGRGGAPFPPADECFRDLDATSGDEMPEHQMLWAVHPDERVRMAVVCRWQEQDTSGRLARVAGTALVHALQEAAHEGVRWTPVLDMMACTGCWQDVLQGVGDRPGRPDLPDPVSYVELLSGWIADAPASELARVVEETRFYRVHTLVARHARQLDDATLRRLLEIGYAVKWLARNPSLTPAQWEQLFAWAAERFAAEGQSQGGVAVFSLHSPTEVIRVLAERCQAEGPVAVLAPLFGPLVRHLPDHAASLVCEHNLRIDDLGTPDDWAALFKTANRDHRIRLLGALQPRTTPAATSSSTRATGTMAARPTVPRRSPRGSARTRR